MKRLLLASILLFIGFGAKAQVGVGTDSPNPSAQLEIVAPDRGVLITRVALESTTDQTTITEGNQESLLVYNTATQNDVRPGYYYWYDGKWRRFIIGGVANASNTAMPKFFYMPSVIMPTADGQVPMDHITVNGDSFTVNLYDMYVEQFGGNNPNSVSSSADAPLPILASDEMVYHITWYDADVFDNVQVSEQGVLSYDVKPNVSVTLGSFMNIVFTVK